VTNHSTLNSDPDLKDVASVSVENGIRIALFSFGSILLAEMGDKTQMATVLLCARFHHPIWTFLASALALIASSLVGVWAGTWVARILPPHTLKIGAGVGFILMGGLILWQVIATPPA
jgi:putative Ca2+/H+ antiporter (TMEM165/GDT1 family)